MSTPDYSDYANFALARARAQKMLAELFKPHNFKAIMNTIEPTPNYNNFQTACSTAGLVSAEIDWLWNYLQHCEKSIYDPVPEAAASGW